MGNTLTIPTCRHCNASVDYQSVRASHVFGGTEEHNFWRCDVCDLVYLWPIPTIAEEKKFYADEFEAFMAKRSGKDRDWSGPERHVKSNQDQIKRRWKFLKDYLFDGANILEFGCSSGFMLDAFREAETEPIGIEPSGGFSEFLTKRGHIFYPDIETLKAERPEARFDLIVHFFVLEHIRHTKEFIEEQLSLLSDNGLIIAEVPCVNDPLTALYDIPAFENFYWSIAHHYYFSPASISNVLDGVDCKYEIVPEQRYDLSNHLIWLQKGKPGGQGHYSKMFSDETIENYKNDLKTNWLCDTFFLYIRK